MAGGAYDVRERLSGDAGTLGTRHWGWRPCERDSTYVREGVAGGLGRGFGGGAPEKILAILRPTMRFSKQDLIVITRQAVTS